MYSTDKKICMMSVNKNKNCEDLLVYRRKQEQETKSFNSEYSL